MDAYLKLLNAGTSEERLQNLQSLLKDEKTKPEVSDCFVNNHIHTTYSFSPYSPTAAVYYARLATLPTAGIMDHDSIAGAWEFIKAGEIAGVATTVGVECRVRMTDTSIAHRFINNTDQPGIAYMALHGVPHGQIEYIQSHFAPLREKRNNRTRLMVDNINNLLRDGGIVLDFESDVLPISQYKNGGSVTERHLIFALCQKIIAHCGMENTAEFVENTLGVSLSEKQRTQLTDLNSPFFAYDLLGVLKSAFVEKIYVPATEECMHISELSALAKKTDSLLCYAYLGDVGTSVTGDKRSGRFEDGYLPELFDVLRAYDVDAVTYMPSRNTVEQLCTIQKMCKEYGFMQISGEDINSPRQSFICPQLAQPEYRHLVKATWDLIERERVRSK